MKARADLLFRVLTIAVASSLVFLTAIYVIELYEGSSLTIGQGWGFISGSSWDTIRNVYGAYPMIWGSFVTSAIALVLAVPISVAVAVFLSEVSTGRVRSIVGFVIEMLSAVPSVIYGLWGLFILSPILSSTVYPAVEGSLGFLPIFSCPDTFSPCFFTGVSVMTAGIILTIMVIPIISSISRDAMLAVPDSQREAAYALGATKSEVISMSVLSYARSGIIASVFLGFARAIGETMAVVMLIGNVGSVQWSLFSPGYTLASRIANEFQEASSPTALSALTEAGLVLLLVSLATSFAGRLFVRRFVKAREAASYL